MLLGGKTEVPAPQINNSDNLKILPRRGLDRSNPVLLHYAPRVCKNSTELNKAHGNTEGNC